MTDLKIGDLVEVNKMDIGVITYIDEEEQIADVEIEKYDHKTELPHPIKDLRKFKKGGEE